MRASIRRLRRSVVLVALALACADTAGDLESGRNAVDGLGHETEAIGTSTQFAAGSLIIPMDTTYQDATMLKAYGLVTQLLVEGVTVNWTIASPKVLNGTDFTASATDVSTGATITAHAYEGGPFVIDSSNAAAALTIITQWNTPAVVTTVHKATAAFTANVQEQLVAAPQIAIDADGYENIAFNYLNAAGITDSNGNAWPTATTTNGVYPGSPDVLTPTQVANGALLNADGTLAFTNLTSMHYAPPAGYNAPAATNVVLAVRNWLGSGPLPLAVMECLAITAFENDTTNGLFLTTNGFNSSGTTPNSVTIELPANPLDQMTGTVTPEKGAVTYVSLAGGSTFNAGVNTLAIANGSANDILWVSGNMDGNTANGVIAYLGGHDYGESLPVSTNQSTNGTRLYLDSFLETAAIQSAYQPVVAVTVTSPAVNPGGTIVYTITYKNTATYGVASSFSVTDTLPAGVQFVSNTGAAVITGQQIAWSGLGNLKPGGTGTVTVTGKVSADGSYANMATAGWNVGRTAKSVTSAADTTVFPSTQIATHPGSLSSSTTAAFTLTSSAANATYACTLDGNPVTCSASFTLTGLAAGSHTLVATSTAVGGNSDLTPPSFTWTIGLTLPSATFLTTPPALTNSTTATFVYGSSETPVTFGCKLDAATTFTSPCPTTFTGLAAGAHKLTIEATDAYGNVTAAPLNSYSWTIDTTPPVVTLDTYPPAQTNTTSATFTFHASKAVVGYDCSLDGAAYAACVSGVSYSPLAAGNHTFLVTATDAAGNVSAEPAAWTWTINTTPPTATFVSTPPAATNSSTAVFTFGSNKSPVTFLCKLDAAATFTACPGAFTGLASTSHTLTIEAVDAFGNVTPAPLNSYTWVVNTTPPVVTITAKPLALTSATTATFQFNAGNAVIQSYSCSLDGATYTTCTSPTTYAGPLAAGDHTFLVTATDTAGNSAAMPASYAWTIDTTKPTVTIVTEPPALTNSTTASFTFSSDVSPVTFLCELDGATTFTACPASFTGLSNGPHTVTVEAVDSLGNTTPAPYTTYTWTVDTTPPVVTIQTGPAAATNATSASFSLHASETVSFECALDGAGFAPCTALPTFTGLGDGSHTLLANGTDAAGNTAAMNASWTWTIDTTTPTAVIESGPALQTDQTTATFTFQSDKSPVTFECELDGVAPFAPCPASYTGLASGPHTLTVEAVDALGNTTPAPLPTYTWTINTATPITSIVSGPAPVTNQTTATFVFNSSILPSTYGCELDGASMFTPCPASFGPLMPGAHTLTVQATDVYGASDPNPPSYMWSINTTDPVVTIQKGPPPDSNSSTASFTFVASEPVSGFMCSLTGAPYMPCSASQTFTGLTDGPQILLVTATDSAGNMSPTPATWSWTVSTTAPTTFFVTTPPAVTNQTTATFTYGSNESPNVTFQCELDGAAMFTPCQTTYAGLMNGSHTLTAQAVDEFGNVDPNPPSYSWTVQTVPPIVTITSGPPLLSNSASAAFTLKATEAVTGFVCSLDGAAFVACTATPSYTGLSNGSHLLLANATDAAGNMAQTPASYSWTINTGLPTVVIVTEPPAVSGSSTAVFTFGSSESPVTYECELDNAMTFTPCPAAFTGLANGSHTLTVEAVDMFGNTSPAPEPSYTWTIDDVPPVVTILSGPAMLTNSSTASFTLMANKMVTSFLCSVDGVPFATCTATPTFAGIAMGTHTLQASAVDAAGLTATVPALYTWAVDTTPPDTVIVTKPPAVSTSATANFTFSSNKSPVTYQCELDSAATWTACTGTFPGLTDGSHTLLVRAVDAAGNVDPNPPSYTWVVDTNPPTTSIGSMTAPDGSPSPAGFSSDKSPVTYQCELDGSMEWAPCPSTLAGLPPGTHTVTVRAVDQYGVADPNPPSVTWTVTTQTATTQPEQFDGARLGCSSSGAAPWMFTWLLLAFLVRRRAARLRVTGA